MKKTMVALVSAAVAAVPAMAIQQQGQAPRAAVLPPVQAGQLILFEMTNYNGDSWTIDSSRPTVHTDWNIRSIAVHPGDRWQICAQSRYRDPCIILDRSVNDATLIGVEGQIGSARPAPH